MDCGTPGFLVLHYVQEFAQTHIHWVGDAIQPSHPLSPSSPPALNLSQHQGLFQWIGSSHYMAKVLELQLQHQSFQWIFKVDLPYGNDLIKGCWTNEWTLFTESLAIKGTLFGPAWSMGLLLSPQNSCLVIWKKNFFNWYSKQLSKLFKVIQLFK